MTIEIRVPELPESISDAVIASWLKKEGDFVEVEEPLLELETDKVVLEVPATESGILTKITQQQGATVVADDVLGLFEPQEKGISAPIAAPIAEATSTQQSASPSVRKTMYENDVSKEQVTASGEKGHILKSDVETVVAQRNQANQASQVNNEATNKTTNEQPKQRASTSSKVTNSAFEQQRKERRVPMSRLRQRVAERLLEAQSNAAILTTFNEVDLSDISRLRKTYQERFQHAHKVKLGFMSFFVKAATEALKRFPEVNARIEGNDIIYQGFYDIGVAVSTERGLVVPLLRDTDQMGHASIEKNISDFATRAKKGKLTMEELTGGTFSISNGGVFGSLLSTPILNPPQSAILGMHKIEDRAVVIDGEVVVRPMMYLALSYDHRIIDGKAAVGFLMQIKGLLEDPASLLLEL